MAFYIDLKYLKLVSSKLEGFTQKNPDLYNFRCPFCGDSSKKKSKKRGFAYRKNNDMFYKCFNDSGCSTTFYNFLSRIDPGLAKEYSIERFVNGENKQQNYSKPKIKPSKPIFKNRKTEFNIPSISSLDEKNIAKMYIIGRKIPKGFHKDIYYAEDFKKFITSLQPKFGDNLLENDKRIVIPFRDYSGNVFAIQGRSLGENKLRYITIKFNNELKLFGLDRLNRNAKIYVTEGPIDSLFLDNAVATADSNLTISEFLGKENIVLVYDNEPRNKQIVNQIEKSIDMGFSVCLFPESFGAKDINEAIMNGMTKPQLKRMIDSNTYSGLSAKLCFNNWRRN